MSNLPISISSLQKSLHLWPTFRPMRAWPRLATTAPSTDLVKRSLSSIQESPLTTQPLVMDSATETKSSADGTLLKTTQILTTTDQPAFTEHTSQASRLEMAAVIKALLPAQTSLGFESSTMPASEKLNGLNQLFSGSATISTPSKTRSQPSTCHSVPT